MHLFSTMDEKAILTILSAVLDNHIMLIWGFTLKTNLSYFSMKETKYHVKQFFSKFENFYHGQDNVWVVSKSNSSKHVWKSIILCVKKYWVYFFCKNDAACHTAYIKNIQTRQWEHTDESITLILVLHWIIHIKYCWKSLTNWNLIA